MDFKQFLEQIKGLTDPAIFAIIAKFAIGFYFLKLLFKGFKELLKFIFAIKEKKDDYKDLQKTNLENKEEIKQLKEAFEKANIANQKRDEETHKLIKQFMLENEKKISKLEEDLNAYKKVKHGKDNEVEESRKTMKLVLEKLTKQ
jgi:biopolymer transport protein ExbB/TolQ